MESEVGLQELGALGIVGRAERDAESARQSLLFVRVEMLDDILVRTKCTHSVHVRYRRRRGDEAMSRLPCAHRTTSPLVRSLKNRTSSRTSLSSSRRCGAYDSVAPDSLQPDIGSVAKSWEQQPAVQCGSAGSRSVAS